MEKERFIKLKKAMINDIHALVAIPSVVDEDSICENAPFGMRIRESFDCFKSIVQDKGFAVEEDEGYAISASIGEGDAYLGILAHLDVVSAGDHSLWNTSPYQLCEKDGMLYGRGVNDDKGPLIAAVYAAWLIKEQQLPLRYPIRIIAGGAEETTWNCMKHYFQTHAQPIYGFSPDGNFPIVNGEKGILQVRFLFPPIQHMQINSKERCDYVCDELTVTYGDVYKVYQGKRALSRNPQRGENAIYAFVKDENALPDEASLASCIALIKEQFLEDDDGVKSGLSSEDPHMGSGSLCLMSLTCHADVFELCVDIRYVRSISEARLWERLMQIAHQYGAELALIKKKRLLYVAEDSELIQGLKKAYQRVMHEEAQVLTKGGASYARVLNHGVAFGATFPGEDTNPHMPNEGMSIASLLQACEIYYEAMMELAVDRTALTQRIDEKLPQ